MNKVNRLSILMFVFVVILLVSCAAPSQGTIEMVSNLTAQRYGKGVKLTWDYDLPAIFKVYRGNGGKTELLGSTEKKYYIDENPDSIKNHYYVKAMYNGKESSLCEVVIDLQAPQVSIVSPKDGSILSGTVTIEANAQDDTSVEKVEFYIDGTNVSEITIPPYKYNWDTTNLTNNSTHTIQAKAYDFTGNVGESNLINVTIKNPIPQITIVSPKDGDTLEGTVTIAAEVQDDEGIAKVEFWVSDGFLKEFTSSPYEYVWNTLGTADGTYKLKVKATNLLWRQSSVSINVTVNNGQRTYGGDGYDEAHYIEQTSDGGYIVVGWTNSFGKGGSDVYVLKLDSNRNMEWHKEFGGAESDYGCSVQQTSDGGYIVAGYTKSSGNGDDDVYILKLNSDGELKWEKTFGGELLDRAYSIQQTSDGGYIVAGYTKSSGNGDDDVYILKLNSDGELKWEKTFGGELPDRAYSIQQTEDGGYIVAGYTYSFDAGIIDVYILKLDADGGLVWQKTYGGTSIDVAYSIQQTNDGGYIVVGNTQSSGAGNDNVYVLKLDSNGNLTWEKTFGGTESDYAYSVQQTKDGGYIVGGYTYSFGAGGADAYILKLNSDGDLTWQKTYGGNSTDIAYCIQQTTDEGYIVAGRTSLLGAHDVDAYVLKLDSDGKLEK
ncbi:MAG TPA: Ig-like domain-containing protein [Fervidobacterium sp.]|nr:Ig-like domain-containing protein [Fervidobacterium sp.]HPT54542.1 Ig-like domain-containing protein [Fervidobacterium sp.]HPZ17949.1 Ig-like domain-containing protein [Fervidobacterium sp.]HUM42417.1 Ig-like domain-containing protein [Fervidobacterium sp.]